MTERKFHVGIKALILNDKNEILILKANPEELIGGVEHWDIPGGRIKEGDSVEETLRKEVEEELGINRNDIKIMNQFDASVSNLKIPVGNEIFGLILFVYLCKFKEEKEFNLSFEHTEYKWCSIDEAKELLGVKFPKSFIDKLDDFK